MEKHRAELQNRTGRRRRLRRGRPYLPHNPRYSGLRHRPHYRQQRNRCPRPSPESCRNLRRQRCCGTLYRHRKPVHILQFAVADFKTHKTQSNFEKRRVYCHRPHRSVDSNRRQYRKIRRRERFGTNIPQHQLSGGGRNRQTVAPSQYRRYRHRRLH